MGSSPNWTFGFVPTPAQWSQAFSSKQDDLGYTPVNRAGDTMAGRLVTFASNPASAGFNVQPGVAPNVPSDGDIWFTSTGIFAQVGGSTVGPISTGTVSSVGLTAPAEFSVTGSPVTDSGDLALSWADAVANRVLAGPTTGADAEPTFRALVGDDLPDPSDSSKGGVKSKDVVSSQFLTSIGTDGTPTSAQPAFSDISGQATSGQIAAGVAVANLGFTPLNPANNLSELANKPTSLATLGGAALATANSFSASQSWAKGANIASAATLTLGTDGNLFHVTGTTTITAISGAASPVYLVFDGALTLTHNATSLILQGGANITTVAGDRAIFISEGSGNWRCVSYIRAVSLPYVTTNILGTVSQTGGVPTGAIIERGTGANGSYVRFADGTQICMHVLAGVPGYDNSGSGGFSTPSGTRVTWTYPAAFAVGSTVHAFAQIRAALLASVLMDVPGVTTLTGVGMWGLATSSTARDISVQAIGRWF